MAMGDADLTIGAPGPVEVDGDRIEDDATGWTDTPAGDVLGGELLPDVAPEVVRGIVSTLGKVASRSRLADIDVDDHWEFTDRELDDLTPPLTRIVNRRPALKRAVMHGDEAIVAVALAGYLGRNFADAREAKEARDDDDFDREAGEPARGADPAGSGADGRGWLDRPGGSGIVPPHV
jgi:hypothetical protein